MRADLQLKIRLLVEELGPEIFEDFEKSRVVPKQALDSREYHQLAATKLGRGEKFSVVVPDDDSYHINTVFGKEFNAPKFKNSNKF